jgi:stage III sporulation protein AE
MSQDLDGVLNSQLSRFDLSGLDQPGLPSFRDLVFQIVAGEFDFTLPGILNLAARQIFNELFTNTRLIRQLLIIAILNALLSCLSDAFKHKSASELGFYVSYCIMVILAVSSFHLSVDILSNLVYNVTAMMEASVPLIISMMAISGNVAGAAVFHPALFLAMGLIARFIAQLFVPLLMAGVGLRIVSHLTEGNPLERMGIIIKKGADWALKGIVGLFALLLALQKLTAPVINNVALKTTKTAVGAIPVVGGALNAAMDTVLVWGQAARSGVLAALVIVICAALAAPLIKMLVLMLVYKLMAAAVQPITDERFCKCLDGVGEYMGTLLGAGAIVGIMCIYAVIMLLSF